MPPRIHPTAEVSPEARIGDGTNIWHQSQIRERAAIGKDCNIGKGVYVDFDVVIGDRCKLQNYVCVYHGVRMGNGVFVGPHATFTNDFYPRAESEDWKVYETVVEDGVSIGANATIICGIRIGRYAMIGAGSVVTRDVPPHALVYGNPARLRGWVCRCGERLEEDGPRADGEDDGRPRWRCPKCGVVDLPEGSGYSLEGEK
ncbi:MAG: N-acetyltransferase [Thermoplasmata archaeon]|nr:N-acetyltransferase [Thermoplasmata archaeon]